MFDITADWPKTAKICTHIKGERDSEVKLMKSEKFQDPEPSDYQPRHQSHLDWKEGFGSAMNLLGCLQQCPAISNCDLKLLGLN